MIRRASGQQVLTGVCPRRGEQVGPGGSGGLVRQRSLGGLPARLAAGGCDGSGDLPWGQAEAGGQGVQIGVGQGDRGLVQGGPPVLAAAGRVGQGERHGDHPHVAPVVGRPGGPGLLAAQDDRARVPGQRRLHGLMQLLALIAVPRIQPIKIEDRVLEAGGTDQQSQQFVRVGGGSQGRAIDRQQSSARLSGHGLGHAPQATAGRALEVEAQRGGAGGDDQPGQPVAHAGRQRHVGQGHPWLDPPAHRPQPGVQARPTQQPFDHLGIELQGVAQQRRLRLVGIGDQVEQAVAAQGGLGSHMGAAGQLRLGGRAEQVEGQIQAGAAARDIVLQEGIEPLVAHIHFGREGDQQQIEVERGEIVGLAQPVEQGAVVRRAVGGGGHPGQDGRAGRLRQQAIDFVRIDIEAPERVARAVRPVDFPGHGSRPLQPPVQPRQGREEGGEAAEASHWHWLLRDYRFHRLNHCCTRCDGVSLTPIRSR